MKDDSYFAESAEDSVHQCTVPAHASRDGRFLVIFLRWQSFTF